MLIFNSKAVVERRGFRPKFSMRESIESPEWKLAFSLMAAYGLRNQEVFNLDRSTLEQSPVLTVLDGKTGQRKVWPFRPEWWQQ